MNSHRGYQKGAGPHLPIDLLFLSVSCLLICPRFISTGAQTKPLHSPSAISSVNNSESGLSAGPLSGSSAPGSVTICQTLSLQALWSTYTGRAGSRVGPVIDLLLSELLEAPRTVHHRGTRAAVVNEAESRAAAHEPPQGTNVSPLQQPADALFCC